MKPLPVIVLFILLVVHWNECQSNYEARYDPETNKDMESFNVSEWKRYVKFQRKKMKELLSTIKKNKKKKMSKSPSDENLVAPSFVLSRTQEGFIVKQLEPGSKSFSKGGFEFPSEPALMTNVKYKYDGSVSPVVKLSETDKGVVGKRLEYGIAQNPGANWLVRSGSSKQLTRSKKQKLKVNENGEINEAAGINQNFSTGSISLRGTLKLLNSSINLKGEEIKEIEPLPADENYDNEIEQFKDENSSFEIEDIYYEDRDLNNDNNDDNNSEYDDNWEGYSDIFKKM